jgi:hypothetical protein
MPLKNLLLAGLALTLVACSAGGNETPEQVGLLAIETVGDGIYALVGSTGPRTEENQALNANYGVVVTDDGAVLIDSGAAPVAAETLHRAVRAVTEEPVKWVINTGSQDHRWLGNHYFAERGAEIIALERTVATQQEFTDRHRLRLERALGEEVAATIEPVHAEAPATGWSWAVGPWSCATSVIPTSPAMPWSGCRRRRCSSPGTWSTSTAF